MHRAVHQQTIICNPKEGQIPAPSYEPQIPQSTLIVNQSYSSRVVT